MQSIFTEFLPATNFNGSRVKAWASDGAASITISWDHALNPERNHEEAARALIQMLGWGGQWAKGSAGPRGYVFVDVTDGRSTVIDARPTPTFRHSSS